MARTIFESVFTNPGKPFRFVGRYSFLDFINTEVNEAGRRVNLLTDARDVVNWLVLAKMFERINTGARNRLVRNDRLGHSTKLRTEHKRILPNAHACFSRLPFF